MAILHFLFIVFIPKTLILVNNKITTIHPKAFSSLGKLQRLYLSKNLLKDVPVNMPKSLQELRIHENEIVKIKKASFQGMSNVIVMGEKCLWNIDTYDALQQICMFILLVLAHEKPITFSPRSCLRFWKVFVGQMTKFKWQDDCVQCYVVTGGMWEIRY